MFHLDSFIAEHVTGRSTSLFRADLADRHDELASRIDGRSVMVIGGAGTIGSSFVHALLRFRPARLVVVDIDENGLTELTRDLRSSNEVVVPAEYTTYPINFGDDLFRRMFLHHGPFEVVANFAAHKHVRSEKDPFSIEAMVENNVVRAGRLLELLVDHPPERFFCVSTDKAANPVNVMGASKKLMEEVILAHSAVLPVATARFANVAFSQGSLPDGFLTRLGKRQPLSAPLGVRRYFVSPQESGELCLLACMLADSGDIFFPLLGEDTMRTFTDIADALLAAHGLVPHRCADEAEARAMAAGLGDDDDRYPVLYQPADTSGEKPYEEFHTEGETVDLSRFGALGVVTDAPRRPLAEVAVMLGELRELFSRSEVGKEDVVALLARWVPTFDHIETGRRLDDKM